MNVKRFTGRNSREAMQKVRQAFGENAVVLSTKPCDGGIEVLAMAPESVEAIEHYRDSMPARLDPASAAPVRAAPAAPRAAPVPSAPAPGLNARAGRSLREAVDRPAEPPAATPSPVQDDVSKLAMSTLSFQDYVRERMLKKRDAEIREKAQASLLPDELGSRLALRAAPESPAAAPAQAGSSPATIARTAKPGLHGGLVGGLAQAMAEEETLTSRSAAGTAAVRSRRRPTPSLAEAPPAPSLSRRRPVIEEVADSALDDSLHDSLFDESPASVVRAASSSGHGQADMMRELRAMKGLIEERFGALAFMERLQKSPKQAALITRLIDCGFSPALIRKLVDSVGNEGGGDEIAWASEVLQRNLITGEQDAALEDQGGVFALIGSTGVGKTTSTAKLAAAFAARHGAGNLGLVTLDAYRLGAHEQLRAYGRILGVPVHTAHDRVALEDLLDLLSSKKLVLIDTAGLAQRDSRTRELLEMLSHPSINRLLVVSAAAQGETTEDVLGAYKASQAKGVVLSKLDEAVKLAPALDAMIRHRLKVVAVANGQRVPEDWHRLTAKALVHRALRATGAHAWRMDANEVNLLFANAGSPPSATPPKRPRPVAARRPAP